MYSKILVYLEYTAVVILVAYYMYENVIAVLYLYY